MRRYRNTDLKLPAHTHPVVRRLFEEMNRQQIGICDMAERAGVNKNTLCDWKHRNNPRIADLDACFHVLGRKLWDVRGDAE